MQRTVQLGKTWPSYNDNWNGDRSSNGKRVAITKEKQKQFLVVVYQ
jgi:hypothetical protein